MDIVAGMGLVESVETGNAAAEAAADAAISDTEIVVAAADIFETDTGTGQLSIAGVVYSYTAVDADTGTLTLASPLTVAVDAGDQIEAYPPAPQTLAAVTLDSGDAVTARVAAAHVPLLPEGDRNGQGREFVTLYREGARYVTLDVPNAKMKIQPAYIPSTGGDIDPDEDIVFIDGPPDSFYHSVVTGYMTYAEAVAYAGSTFTDAVLAIVAADGTITVTGNTISAVGGATHRVYPAWRIPTNGKQCRVMMDAPTVGSGTGLQDLTFEARSEQNDALDSGNLVDNFLYSFDFDSAPDGMSARIWYEHVDQFGDVETSLPAGAIGTASTSDFQLSPLVSLNPSEAGVDDPAAPYIVIVLEYPVASWGGAGSNTGQSFVVNNLRVIRE